MNDSTEGLTAQDFERAQSLPNLGPHYGFAQRIAEAIMSKFTNDDLNEIVKKTSDAIYG